jgi:hypothetical protein
MKSEIIQIVAWDNYDGFQHLTKSYFHKILFPCLKDYLMTKLTLG